MTRKSERFSIEVQIHPEYALSRREIIRYILARPNDRAQDVLELLRLDDIETTRRAITNVVNKLQSEQNKNQQAYLAERRELLQIFELDDSDPEVMLEKVNTSRAVLSLPPLEKLDATKSFKEGVPGRC